MSATVPLTILSIRCFLCSIFMVCQTESDTVSWVCCLQDQPLVLLHVNFDWLVSVEDVHFKAICGGAPQFKRRIVLRQKKKSSYPMLGCNEFILFNCLQFCVFSVKTFITQWLLVYLYRRNLGSLASLISFSCIQSSWLCYFCKSGYLQSSIIEF